MLENEMKQIIARRVNSMLNEIESKDLFRADNLNLYRFNDVTMTWEHCRKKVGLELLFRDFLPYDREMPDFNYNPEKRREIIEACTEVFDILCKDPVFRLPACRLNDFQLPLLGGKCLDLRNLEIKEFTKSDYVTWAADFNYIKDATWEQVPDFKHYLKLSLGIDMDADLTPDKKKKLSLLCELLTYMVSNLKGAKKAFILLGPGDCGKSCLLDFVKQFIGEGGYSPLRFSDLGQRFRSSMLINSNYVINDELGKTIDNIDILKKVISGEEIIAEEKNKPSIVLRPNVKALFATNELPTPVDLDHGSALLLRLQILKFADTIDRKNFILDMKDRLWKERDAIMSLAISNGNEILRNNFDFTEDPDTQSIIENYKLTTNSVKAFVNDVTYVIRSDDGAAYMKEIYARYKQFCNDQLVKVASEDLFHSQLVELGFIKKRMRLYGDKNPRSTIVGLKLV